MTAGATAVLRHTLLLTGGRFVGYRFPIVGVLGRILYVYFNVTGLTYLIGFGSRIAVAFINQFDYKLTGLMTLGVLIVIILGAVAF